MTRHNQEMDNKGEEEKFFHIYLAGLWDGEGSFMLTKLARSKKPILRAAYTRDLAKYVPCGSICMTKSNGQEAIIRKIYKMYGGTLMDNIHPPSKNMNGKPIIMWRIASQKAAIFAKSLLPYLQVKRRQAEIVIRYAELQAKNRTMGSRWYLNQDDIRERESLVIEIKKLNKRGLK